MEDLIVFCSAMLSLIMLTFLVEQNPAKAQQYMESVEQGAVEFQREVVNLTRDVVDLTIRELETPPRLGVKHEPEPRFKSIDVKPLLIQDITLVKRETVVTEDSSGQPKLTNVYGRENTVVLDDIQPFETLDLSKITGKPESEQEYVAQPTVTDHV